MTQADSAQALRMSLDSGPQPGPGQARKKTPLPDGWGSFRSRSRQPNEPAQWYAVAPWDAFALNAKGVTGLVATVSAGSWDALVREVASQVALYEALMMGEDQ